MAMLAPPHPGLSVRYDCLEALQLTVTEGARRLGVSRQALNNLINGKSGISAEMAVRLAKAFLRKELTVIRTKLNKLQRRMTHIHPNKDNP